MEKNGTFAGLCFTLSCHLCLQSSTSSGKESAGIGMFGLVDELVQNLKEKSGFKKLENFDFKKLEGHSIRIWTK